MQIYYLFYTVRLGNRILQAAQLEHNKFNSRQFRGWGCHTTAEIGMKRCGTTGWPAVPENPANCLQTPGSCSFSMRNSHHPQGCSTGSLVFHHRFESLKVLGHTGNLISALCHCSFLPGKSLKQFFPTNLKYAVEFTAA